MAISTDACKFMKSTACAKAVHHEACTMQSSATCKTFLQTCAIKIASETVPHLRRCPSGLQWPRRSVLGHLVLLYQHPCNDKKQVFENQSNSYPALHFACQVKLRHHVATYVCALQHILWILLTANFTALRFCLSGQAATIFLHMPLRAEASVLLVELQLFTLCVAAQRCSPD